MFDIRQIFLGVANGEPVMREPAYCICENKDTDLLHGDHAADQRLCFRYIDSTGQYNPRVYFLNQKLQA